MKIGISCWPTFGGSGVVASELGMGLAERGHEVHFISYAVPGRLDKFRSGIYYHKVSVPDYPLFEYAPYSLALASKMAEVAIGENLHLIHAHYAIPHAVSALLARDMVGNGSLKVITTLHGTDITLVGRDPSFLRMTKHAIERSDAVSAVSNFLKNEICRTFTCSKDVEMIYNFIDPRSCTNIDSERLHEAFSPNGEKLLVHVSNYRSVKRVRDVLEVFLQVRERMPAKLILLGAGPELSKVEKIAVERKAGNDLILLGNQERVEEVIAASDLMLLLSETESFGLAALEAMACQVPCITTDVGGLPEVIEHGVSGYLVSLGDVEAATEYAVELLLDDEKRVEMGRVGRERAFNKFGFEQALDAYESLYRSATGNVNNY